MPRSTSRARLIYPALGVLALSALIAGVVYARDRGAEEPRTPTSLLQYHAPADPFTGDRPTPEEIERALKATVALIRSDNVMATAAARPEVRQVLRDVPDPIKAIRERIEVTSSPDSAIIAVSAREGLDGQEGVTLVRAVVDASLDIEAEWSMARHRRQIEELRRYLEGLSIELDSLLNGLQQTERESSHATLGPDGPVVDVELARFDLRDCLRHLRDVRLEIAALSARPEGEGRDEEIGVLEAQERLLVAQSDRLAEALFDTRILDARRSQYEAEIASLRELHDQVKLQLERLEYESRGPARVIEFSPPRAMAK